MPSTTVYNMAGEAVEKLELSEQVFGVTPNTAVLHQVVTAQLVNRRQGNASTKTRSEVSGGNKKPYKQKGTGNARQGSTRAPQFRHGGVAWGPRPHRYHHDVPKKMRRLAIRSALSDKVANESLIVVNELGLESPSTKEMMKTLGNLPTQNGKRVLMMLPERDENIVLSARNIPTAKVQHVSSINVIELLRHDYLVVPVSVVRWLEMVFGEGLSADEATLRLVQGDTSATDTSAVASEPLIAPAQGETLPLVPSPDEQSETQGETPASPSSDEA